MSVVQLTDADLTEPTRHFATTLATGGFVRARPGDPADQPQEQIDGNGVVTTLRKDQIGVS